MRLTLRRPEANDASDSNARLVRHGRNGGTSFRGESARASFTVRIATAERPSPAAARQLTSEALEDAPVRGVFSMAVLARRSPSAALSSPSQPVTLPVYASTPLR